MLTWDTRRAVLSELTAVPEPSKQKRSRRGARAAMHARRAAPLPEALRPVRPGLPGGNYRLLDKPAKDRIHMAALDILASIGLADAPKSGVELMIGVGAQLNDSGRLLFPRALIEDTLAKAARRFPIHGQRSEHDLEPWGRNVYFGTAGAAVHIVDPISGKYRDSLLSDLYDAARLVDVLEHVHFFQRPLVARDMQSGYDLDINTCYASVSGTAKHVGTSFITPDHVDTCLSMLHLIAGGEDRWRERPFVSNSNCFVVPPLKFATESCQVMEAAVRGGMPVLLLSAGQAGATAPAALAGAVTQAVAEVLAGLVYVNAIKPGAPAIFGTWPFVSDLRSGAMSGGSGEQTLLMAACAEMAHYYDLPGGVCAGITDAKLPDAQAGFEKGYAHALVGNAGANMIYEAAGMHASLLGFSLESLIIDNDAIGAALRTVRGFSVDDDTLSVEVMREVCLQGPGHYLGHQQTLALMQSEYLYPKIADRLSPKQWQELGSVSLVERAVSDVRRLLDEHIPTHIDIAIDKRIRDTLPIKLPPAS